MSVVCLHQKVVFWDGGDALMEELESAHKSIPPKRMKLSGACWHPERINPMLSLRVLRANGWWDDFWENSMNQKLAA